MKESLIHRVDSLLEPFSQRCEHLECDGFTRVAHHVLKKEKIPHEIWLGALVGKEIPHLWLTIFEGEWVIDYRLKMWASNAPYGIFALFEHEEFVDRRCQLQPDEIKLSEELFRALVQGVAAQK